MTLFRSLSSAFALLAVCASAMPADAIDLNSGWSLQEISKAPQSGETLSSPDFKPDGWYRATVPGTVLTSLVNERVYPEPLYGENNRPDRIPDSICRASYWFTNSFEVPRAYSGKHVWLQFDGINYEADVWLNGHDLGQIKGAFTRGLFDVTSLVKPGARAGLAVKITPQPHPGVTHEKTVANGVGPNGGVTAQDGATFLCSIGWDWIPTIRDRDAGIWQGVSLSASGPIVVDDPFVDSDLPLPKTDSADLTLRTTLKNVSDSKVAGVLTGRTEGIKFEVPVTLAAGETRELVLRPSDVPALHVRKPRLWWPNGYGPQNLYTLRLEFRTAGAVSDRKDFEFGIRKISYFLPGSDNLAISVNGVPVLCKGGDWGMDEAMKRIGHKRLDAQVRMHQEANYTMIRNWVGQSTSEEFYKACDKYGMLVWDEFFQPNPVDGPNPDDPVLYLANVREKILRFRSHPCIALWCARNEGDPPPAIHEGLKALTSELDPSRLYQPSSTSGHGVNSGGPYCWRAPRFFYSFGEAFKTEIGSMSVPTLEAIHAMMPSKDWDTFNDDWAEHDFARGAQQGDRYPSIVAERYGALKGTPDFVRKAQLMNFEAFRAMYEGRNAKLFHPSTGVLTWMSNPSQPSFVWQIYSHDLEPNASLFGARAACEPLHIQMNQNDWHVMVINNTPVGLSGYTAKTSIYNLDSTLVYSHSAPVTAPASAATDLGAVAFPQNLSPVHFVDLQLADAKGRIVSDNFYWRSAPEHEDDFTALDSLTPVNLDVHATRQGGKGPIQVTLNNSSKTIALMAHLQLRRANSGERILPAFYGENYLSLLPGQTKTLTIEFAKEDLGSDTPAIALDGWNIVPKRIPVTGS